MSDTASSPNLTEGKTGQRIGWSCELILLLLVLASRPGPSMLLSASYFIAGVLHPAMGLVFAFACLFIPPAVMLAMIVRLVIRWSRTRLFRRLVWIGLVLLSATAMCVKEAPWVPLSLDSYVSKVLPSELAYLYGFRLRVQCCADVPAIRTWARDNRGLYITWMSDAFPAGRVPDCVRWLGPSSASVLPADSTAVFEGTMVFNENWVLVVCQEDSRAPDFQMQALPVATGVWVTWAGERGAAP